MLARDNPFRIEQVLKIRYYMDDGQLELLLQRWNENGNRGALVGPEGSGKTTLLEDIAKTMKGQGIRIRWVQFHHNELAYNQQQMTHLSAPQSDQEVLFLDGAEQLSWFTWQKLVWSIRPTVGLLITSHQPGLLPTIWECSTSPEILIRIVGELSPQSGISQLELLELFEHHRGNVREVLRELYDRCAMS